MGPDAARRPLTRVLLSTRPGGEDSEAFETIFEAVYGELKRRARGLMRHERAGHTLRPTALVHEAYLRLIDAPALEWTDRARFIGIAVRAMRQILVEYARAHDAQKRGGGVHRITLDEAIGSGRPHEFEILDLHLALERLEALDDRLSRVVTLRALGGLTAEETAHLLGFSKRTVDTDWRVGMMWLRKELGAAPS